MLSVLLLLAAVAGGTLLTYLYDDEGPIAARACAGIPIGLALLGLVGFIVSSVLGGIGSAGIALTGLAVVSPVLLLARAEVRARARAECAALAAGLRGDWPTLGRLALGLLVAALLWRVFDRAMFERAGAIYTGVDHNLGDLPFHTGIIMGFAKGGNFPPEHPELAGARLTYPFLADFVSAILVGAGAALRQALLAPGLLLALALVGLLHRLALKLTGDPLSAFLTPMLLLLNGGFGFVVLFDEARLAPGGLLGLLRHLPHDYTMTPTGEFRWGNVVTALLMPQRALVLGLPLALVVWTLWWRALVETEDDGRRTRLMVAAGAVAGLLPLAHVHSLALMLGIGGSLALLFPRWRAWGAFFGVALALAAPQIAWLAHGSSVKAGTFVAWHFGWDRGGRNALWFWLANTGLLIPLLAVALVGGAPRALARFTLPFLLCFVVPNLLKLSPWIWDNIKFLLYWHLASAPIVALLLARLWRAGGARRAGSVVLVASLTLAGGLDVWRVVSGQLNHRIFEAEGLAFSSAILEKTPPRSLILHSPTIQSPVYWSGRRSLLGYPGHIWSQGLDAGSRENEIRRVYAGAPDAEVLLGRYGVDYILVGPEERSGMPVDDRFLERYPKVGESGSYCLYRVAREAR